MEVTKLMQLYFIRHAQSENNALWNSKGDYSGRSDDPELTDIGKQQADFLADFLSKESSTQANIPRDMQNTAGFNLTHLYTSLMVRAVQTSVIVRHVLNLPLVAWVDLHEGGGVYRDNPETGEHMGLPGKGRSFFETHFPDLILPDWLDDRGWWNKPFETREERRLRARRVLDQLLQRHGDSEDRVAFFSHGGFYNHLLTIILNLIDQPGMQPPQSSVKELNAENIILNWQASVWFEMNNTAISRFDFNNQEIKLDYHNRVAHLPPNLIT
jgi:2,3-bisphosphoglycerate-dependent phosphoglycerate mutase